MDKETQLIIASMNIRMEKVEKLSNSSVSFAVFSLAVVILVSIFSYMAFQINNLAEDLSETQVSVAEIAGKLEPFSLVFKN